MSMKIAFVVSWFSENAKGGAESQCRNTAHALEERGCDVEILTTCIEKHDSDWGVRFFEPGQGSACGFPVRRFEVARCSDPARFRRLNAKLLRLNEEYAAGRRGVVPPLTSADEDFFVNSMARSPDLEKYIVEHRTDYDFFLFLPYLFATSLFGVPAAADRSVLVPCLHNESYAYTSAAARMFRAAGGVLFNSMGEARLAGRIISGMRSSRTVGEGVTFFEAGEPDRFRRRYGIKKPYLLYLGRKHWTKNVHELIMNMLVLERVMDGQLALVLAGPGRMSVPDNTGIVDLGYISGEDKNDALAGALALVNPSTNESFSLVLMESWLSRRPVLVNRACDVTVEHCLLCHGGLSYGDPAEFVEAVSWLLHHPAEAESMGKQGEQYVRQNYDWPTIADRYLAFMRSLRSA